jgi:isopentenyl-diphosphate delta-isomerase type 1
MRLPKGSDEPLILVDEGNRTVGAAPKQTIHRQGLLHRAFSIFMLDARGRILLQRRNPRKYHSGGLWANSCCGHPRPGERTVTAARRRLNEELGVTEVADLEFLSLRDISRRIKQKPGSFTYWMKHYIRHHHGEIARHIQAEIGQREGS